MSSVTEHYGRGGLLRRILDALLHEGRDIDHLTEADLSPVDEFHSRGKAASLELIAASGFTEGMRILDVGSGIGGPARRLARMGYHVVGVDLTPEFVVAAQELTRRSGLEDRVEFHVASALDLPFPDDAFDAAWMQHVNMNILEKRELFAELARVVKPGGRLALHEVVLGSGGDPYLPAPWASEPENSHLVPAEELAEIITSARFRIDSCKDDTAATIEFFDSVFERFKPDGPPAVGLHLLFGNEMRDYLTNFLRSLKEGRCRIILCSATRHE